MKPLKINDTNSAVTVGSKADSYLRGKGFSEYVSLLRPGLRIPPGLNANNTDSVVKQFQLKGIGFGNWVTLEDRLNYCNALIIAFYDLNKVLRFGYNIGLKKNLIVTFGDRGIPRSLAHYNPANILININRYNRNSDFDKKTLFLSTGGIHSFAHEYGHFLDFFAGSVFEQDPAIFSLSDGISVSRSKTARKTPMRVQMDEILYKLTWKKSGELTNYYKGLVEKVDTGVGFGDYWLRRTEIFARCFESYIKYELEQMGIKNAFLTKLSYSGWTYPDNALLETIVPDMRKLITLIRAKI